MSPPPVEITIDALAAGGDAVGRDEEGRVVFVPYAAPGERVRVAITEQRKQFARGELLEVLAASPGRAEPPCPYFRARSCGGCVWQHIEHAAQAEAKQAIAAGALRRLVAGGMELRPILTPVEPYHWRRRARLHWFRPAKSPAALIGFFAPRSHKVTNIERCPQVEPALEEALGAIQRLLGPGLTGRGEIDLLAGAAGGVQVAIHGPCRKADAEALVGQGGIVGVLYGHKPFGAATVEIEPGQAGRADQFAQASRAGNRALLELVEQASRPREGARVLELYAGSGNFTRALLEGAASVLAVEVHRGQALEHPRLRWRHRPVEEVVAGLARKAAALAAAPAAADGDTDGDAAAQAPAAPLPGLFDLVVLDPPREGARAALEPLAALGAPRIVYVSCDPATLARDLGELEARGYRPRWAQPLDLMPQTAHIEIVAVLERT